jgi:hypothetical protein
LVIHGPKNNQTAESYQLSSVNIKMGLNGYVLFKLTSERKPELTQPLGIFPVHINKNKANPEL